VQWQKKIREKEKKNYENTFPGTREEEGGGNGVKEYWKMLPDRGGKLSIKGVKRIGKREFERNSKKGGLSKGLERVLKNLGGLSGDGGN